MKKAIIIFVGYFFLVTNNFVTSASASECSPESYFAPSDSDNKKPLSRPHPDFLKMQRLANLGNAVEQRNLAVSYETGYLVTQCPEKALYWYQKAAENRDELAQRWIWRRNQLTSDPSSSQSTISNYPSSSKSTSSSYPVDEHASKICKFSYYVVGDEKGQALAADAKQECLRNEALKKEGRGAEARHEAYNLWKDHEQMTSYNRNEAINRTSNTVNGMLYGR